MMMKYIYLECEQENRDPEEEREVKGETGRSNPTRRNRAAAIHNQSERVLLFIYLP